jgi:hypothetical protein
MKLVWLFYMRLNETYTIVHIDKCLSETLPFRHGLKKADTLFSLLLNFTLE